MSNQTETIDAHSKKAGTFSESRTVNGKPVWLTAEGARAYDSLRAAGFGFEAQADPGAIRRMLLGDFVGPQGEQHQGTVK
ncbi:MAG: hypothetical protein ACOZIN_09795 [Myxococcota bacterium]